MRAQTDSVTVLVEIVTDYFPQECTFTVYSGLVETDPALYALGPFVGTQGTMNTYSLTLAQGCYTFKAMDSHGDGFAFTNGHIYVTYVNQDSSLVQLNGFYPSPFFATACLYLPQVSEQIPGCMDPEATNYNPLANVSDQSCEYASILGCIDPIAENYDSTATVDDGSCEYIFGCMDSIAENYNLLATMDDGNCEYIFGCMDSIAENYNPLATMDDGNCEYIFGCTDPSALNFNEFATYPDFSSPPYWGCEYWVPDTITVVQVCNQFVFYVTSEDGTEMPESAAVNNWSIGNDIYVENGGTTLPYTIEADGIYTVVFIYSQGQFFTSVEVTVVVENILPATLTQVGDALVCTAPNAQAYTFTFEGMLFPQQEDSVFVPLENGGYTCIVSNSIGCQTETNVVSIEIAPVCCLADFDCNGTVGVSDLIILLDDYGCISNCSADLNHDDITNINDLIIFIGKYGVICP